MKARFHDMAGQRFGRLVVLTVVGKATDGSLKWKCRCDCGSFHVVSSANLRNGHVSSCGCFRRETRRTHGLYRAPEYKIWSEMIQRCGNPNNAQYAQYGGRGIVVCERWLRFEIFYADMGQRPRRVLTLERRDNNEGYTPTNCYWATKKEQANNTRATVFLNHNGLKKPRTWWAERIGIAAATLRCRIDRGWSVERALTTPVQARRSKG